MAQLKTGLGQIYSALGSHKIDFLGFDECLMAQTEVMGQMDEYVSYAFGSEKTEPGDGWPYNPIVGGLCSNPTMTGSAFTIPVAQKYVASASDTTGSAVDLSKCGDMLSAIDALAQAIIAAGSGIKSSLSSAVSATEEYDSYSYYDLWHLCAQIQSKVSTAAVKTAAANLQTVIGTYVLYSGHTGSGNTNAHGVTIYWGTDYSNSEYTATDFCSQTKWDDMLRSFA